MCELYAVCDCKKDICKDVESSEECYLKKEQEEQGEQE